MKIVGEDLSYELDEFQEISVIFADDPLLVAEYQRAAVEQIEKVDSLKLRDAVEKDSEQMGISKWNMKRHARNFRRSTRYLLEKLATDEQPDLDASDVLRITSALTRSNVMDVDANIKLGSEIAPSVGAAFVIDAVESRNRDLREKAVIDKALKTEVEELSTNELYKKFKDEGRWHHEDPLYVLWNERRGRERLEADVESAFELSRQFGFSLSDACLDALERVTVKA